MNVTTEQAEKVLTGNYKFTQLGFSMLITRMKGIYAKSPSPETLETCVAEMNMFFQKFGAIMANDFAVISKL